VAEPLLISGSFDCTIAVRSALTFEVLHTFTGHAKVVRCLAVVDHYLFSGSWDCTVRVWNLNSRAHEGALNLRTYVNAIAAHSGRLYSGSKQGAVCVWKI
jgi:WD40 repeat protein